MRPRPLQINTICSQLKQIDSRWSQLKMNSTFQPRNGFAFCSQGQSAYLHGGSTTKKTLDNLYMCRFDQGAQSNRGWIELQQKKYVSQYDRKRHRRISTSDQLPGKLRGHTMNAYLNYLIIVGGQRSLIQYNKNIYAYNLKTQTWRKMKISNQNKQLINLITRQSHSSFVYSNYLYLFGGFLLQNGQHTNKMVKINLMNIDNGQIKIEIIQNKNIWPSSRSNFALTILQNNAFLFGGTNSIQFYDDFWKFNISTQQWIQIQKTYNNDKNVSSNHPSVNYYPPKRKGAVLVAHQQSSSLILFGGMQHVTRQMNDLSIFLTRNNKWIRIHSNTNNIYDPSPTIKMQQQLSPTLLNLSYTKKKEQQFKFKMMNVQITKNQQLKNKSAKLIQKKQNSQKIRSLSNIRSRTFNNSQVNNRICSSKKMCQKNNIGLGMLQFNLTSNNFSKQINQGQKKKSLIQQKRQKQFLFRKKKLLSDICANNQIVYEKRPQSPTSQCINRTLNQLGQQQMYMQNPQINVPKVIFNQQKKQVIGKKPCARDGHAAFAYGQFMYIIGGDRHKVSFNDTHLLRMDKAIQSISYYL